MSPWLLAKPLKQNIYLLIIVGPNPTKSNHNGSVAGTNQVLLAPQRLYVSIMRSVLPEDKSFGGWRMAWWFPPWVSPWGFGDLGKIRGFEIRAGGKPSRWFFSLQFVQLEIHENPVGIGHGCYPVGPKV